MDHGARPVNRFASFVYYEALGMGRFALAEGKVLCARVGVAYDRPTAQPPKQSSAKSLWQHWMQPNSQTTAPVLLDNWKTLFLFGQHERGTFLLYLFMEILLILCSFSCGKVLILQTSSIFLLQYIHLVGFTISKEVADLTFIMHHSIVYLYAIPSRRPHRCAPMLDILVTPFPKLDIA